MELDALLRDHGKMLRTGPVQSTWNSCFRGGWTSLRSSGITAKPACTGLLSADTQTPFGCSCSAGHRVEQEWLAEKERGFPVARRIDEDARMSAALGKGR